MTAPLWPVIGSPLVASSIDRIACMRVVCVCLCVRVIFEGIKLLLMSTAWWRLLWFHPVTHTRLGTSSPIGRTKAPTRKNT